MKIIILRGSTAVGKTDIVHLLENNFKNSAVIHLDDFNIKNLGDKKTLNLAYDKILKKINSLYESNKEYTLIEGIILDRGFFDKLTEFIKTKKLLSYWFMIKRSPEKIKLNKKRTAKNSPEELSELQNKLDELKIENEEVVLNDGEINESVDFILKNIEI